MQKCFLFVLLFLFACQNRKNERGVAGLAGKKKDTAGAQKIAAPVKPTVSEFFADSCNIGRKSHNKIEIASYSSPDSDYVVTRFYAKEQSGWRLKNDFKLSEAQYLDPRPEVSDINGDGFNDVTYASLRAARGANDVRKLFVYDKTADKLIYIKNSEDYPNMQNNKELHCIDAFLVSGCNVTVFLKIEKDTLREFASVDQCEKLTVTIYDREGNGKVILTKKTNRFDMTRFKNYRPLKEYDE